MEVIISSGLFEGEYAYEDMVDLTFVDQVSAEAAGC